MKIAVAGCIHGNIDQIYHSLGTLEKQEGVKVSLLIICGDMITIRNPPDIGSMTLPIESRTIISSFHRYYSGLRVAPVLTIFVGGVYEVINYISELPYGGWVCPNVYYMGHASVLNVGGLRIAGLSGIFKDYSYKKGRYECPPYNFSFKSSMLHVRNLEVFRLKQIERPIDIFVSHEWPSSVYRHGDQGHINAILNYKPFLESYLVKSDLGSPASAELLEILKPSYWFAAGLHCKFTATVPHDDEARPKTEFVAFDKYMPGRRFLQIFDIKSKFNTAPNEDVNIQLEYDSEWLGILRNTNSLLSVINRDCDLTGNRKINYHLTVRQLEILRKLFKNDFKVPENFCISAPSYSRYLSFPYGNILPRYINPQTENFCRIMKITDPLDAAITISYRGDDSDCSDNVFVKIPEPEESSTVSDYDPRIGSNYLEDIEKNCMSSTIGEDIYVCTSQSSEFNAGKTSKSPSSYLKTGWEAFTPQPSGSSSGSNSRPKPSTSSIACVASEKRNKFSSENFTPQPSSSSYAKSKPRIKSTAGVASEKRNKLRCENVTSKPSCSSSISSARSKPSTKSPAYVASEKRSHSGWDNFTLRPDCSSFGSFAKSKPRIKSTTGVASEKRNKLRCENFTPKPSCSSSISNARSKTSIKSPACVASEKRSQPGSDNFILQPCCSSSDSDARSKSTACVASKKQKVCNSSKDAFKKKFIGQ